MSELLSNPIVIGAWGGFVTAAMVDYQAFRAWKTAREATQYDWGVALWRWFQGAVGGAVAAAGLGLVA